MYQFRSCRATARRDLATRTYQVLETVVAKLPMPTSIGGLITTMIGGGGGGGGGNGTPRPEERHVRSSSDITFNLSVNAMVNPICGESRRVYEG